ncbi:hypothetical protein [Azospirillum sp. TSO35-2]|uniref:hypothetical protein n=1 Tax=Azospirillum sp. TSO35-2 TaxID=716796 RepID=UPI000D60C6D7|nr:hypothetical protein [Azospirillum sp. TSO35-2]PWC37749.1 hypothetical protein TSO352_09645 [Azospirillum sp. TSO35-2]
MDPILTQRITALEQEAAALRHRFLHIPLALQEDCGVWASHKIIGREALTLFRAITREARAPGDHADCEMAIGRIEAAYQLVHDAIQSIAALTLAELPTRH